MAADIVGRIALGSPEYIPLDGWHYYRSVSFAALDTRPSLLEVFTNAQMAALTDTIEMGPFDVLEVLPLISAAGTTCTLNAIAYEPIFPKDSKASQGTESVGWMSYSITRLAMTVPSGAVGDISSQFPLIPSTALGFTTINQSTSPTQAPNFTGMSARVVGMVGEIATASLRPHGHRIIRILVTAISASGDSVHMIVRRQRIYSGQ